MSFIERLWTWGDSNARLAYVQTYINNQNLRPWSDLNRHLAITSSVNTIFGLDFAFLLSGAFLSGVFQRHMVCFLSPHCFIFSHFILYLL